MDSLDLEVLTRARDWLADGRRVMLATVVRTWGSSPRPPGALLALRDDGRAVGSVSGGCIEDDLIGRLAAEGLPAQPQVLSYGVGAEEARRFGLPCGGTMELVLEPLDHAAPLNALLDRLVKGELVERRLTLASGAAQLAAAHPEQGPSFDGRTLVSVFGPRYRLLLIGAGQLSAILARMALALDFAVTVCDPRDEWREEWAVTGTTLSREMPDDLVIAMRPDARMAVVALTHDPKLDDLALMEALKSPAFYVGAIGSKKNNDARRKRLEEFELSKDEIARLHGPVGLYLGSKTPPEIALAIMAEMTAVRYGVPSVDWAAKEQSRFAPSACEVAPATSSST